MTETKQLDPHIIWLLEQALRIIGDDFDEAHQDIIDELIFVTLTQGPTTSDFVG